MISLSITNMNKDKYTIITCKKDLISTLMMENRSINNNLNFLNHNNLGSKFNEIILLCKIELSVDGPILLANFCFQITMNKMDGT